MSGKSIFNINNIKPILNGRIPGQLVIQYTDFCNGACPQCGMRKTEAYKRSKLPKEELYRIIDSAAEQNIQAMSFTGGEPFIFKDELVDLIRYASGKGIPLIRTGTNGFLFADWENPDFDYKVNKLAEELSETSLRNFWISIDSADPETHEQMRGLKGVIKGIEKALPIFHKHGIYPAANLGINRNTGGAGKIPPKMTDKNEFYIQFREAFEAFYDFIINLGFTMTNACYPMSIEKENNDMSAVYGASSSNLIVSFTKEEKTQIFHALMNTIPIYRSKIRIFTPLVSLYSLIMQYEENADYSLPCRGGIDFFFIDAKDGNTYPCGYRGNDKLGKLYNLNINKISDAPYCKACDWECFRDPSEQIGFLIQTIKSPVKSLHEKDPLYRQLWKQDLEYYKRCDYFDGRKPMVSR